MRLRLDESERHLAHSCGSIVFDPSPTLRCEVAVVGSGPGGAITACLLAEAGRSVLLIEEGPYLRLDSAVPFSMDEMVQKYRNGGISAALGAVKVQYVEGRCVGGGSEINSALYHRLPPDVLEEWAGAFLVEQFTTENLRPHFEACERELGVGLLPGEAPPASLKLHEGAQRLGWKSFEVPRWFAYAPSEEGGKGPVGRRQSMTETYIPRALRADCRLLPNTRVRRLRQNNAGSRWTVMAQHSDGVRSRSIEIGADTVFVCAGAIQTPAILRRSGVKRNVGNSLRLHPMFKVIAEFPDPVNSISMGVPVHQVKEFAPNVGFGGSVSTPPYLALGMAEHRFEPPGLENRWPNMAVYYASTRGHGRGSVRCLPGFRDPLVRYDVLQSDLIEIAGALHDLSVLLFEAGASTLYPAIANGPRLTSKADLAKLNGALTPERTNLMTVHLFSTCPMGEDRKRCATNSFGKVHDADNLYVSDASLFCGPPGVNPQGTIMALARRNALNFLG